MAVRKLSFKGKTYIITFDEECYVDTVECNGVLLASTNAVVKKILSNAERILGGFIPNGFDKAKD